MSCRKLASFKWGKIITLALTEGLVEVRICFDAAAISNEISWSRRRQKEAAGKRQNAMILKPCFEGQTPVAIPAWGRRPRATERRGAERERRGSRVLRRIITCQRGNRDLGAGTGFQSES